VITAPFLAWVIIGVFQCRFMQVESESGITFTMSLTLVFGSILTLIMFSDLHRETLFSFYYGQLLLNFGKSLSYPKSLIPYNMLVDNIHHNLECCGIEYPSPPVKLDQQHIPFDYLNPEIFSKLKFPASCCKKNYYPQKVYPSVPCFPEHKHPIGCKIALKKLFKESRLFVYLMYVVIGSSFTSALLSLAIVTYYLKK